MSCSYSYSYSRTSWTFFILIKLEEISVVYHHCLDYFNWVMPPIYLVEKCLWAWLIAPPSGRLVLLPHCLADFQNKLHFPSNPGKEAGSHADGNRGGHPLHWTKKELQRKMHEENDGSDANPRTARIVASRSVDVAEVEAGKGQAPKLCGYLTKLSGKGPLRGYKPRWFVYDPRKCYLYYFKTPQDALPLGHIEIGDACFSYDVEAEEGQFAIYTGGKEFPLKVQTSQHCACVALWWSWLCCCMSFLDTPIRPSLIYLFYF